MTALSLLHLYCLQYCLAHVCTQQIFVEAMNIVFNLLSTPLKCLLLFHFTNKETEIWLSNSAQTTELIIGRTRTPAESDSKSYASEPYTTQPL